MVLLQSMGDTLVWNEIVKTEELVKDNILTGYFCSEWLQSQKARWDTISLQGWTCLRDTENKRIEPSSLSLSESPDWKVEQGIDWASWIPWLNSSFIPTKCALSWRSLMLPFWIKSQGDFLQPTDHLQCKTLSGTLATYNVRHLGLVCGPHMCREPADVPILGCGSFNSRHVCQCVLCCTAVAAQSEMHPKRDTVSVGRCLRQWFSFRWGKVL